MVRRVTGRAPPALRGTPLRPPALPAAGRAPGALRRRHVRLRPARRPLQMAQGRFAHASGTKRGGIPGATGARGRLTTAAGCRARSPRRQSDRCRTASHRNCTSAGGILCASPACYADVAAQQCPGLPIILIEPRRLPATFPSAAGRPFFTHPSARSCAPVSADALAAGSSSVLTACVRSCQSRVAAHACVSGGGHTQRR